MSVVQLESTSAEAMDVLRRRLVAGGYCSSAHLCQHCKEFMIVPNYLGYGSQVNKWHQSDGWTVASREEAQQRAAAGCTLWTLITDETSYEILKHKDKRCKDQHAALGDDELRTLDRLQNRSLPNTTYSSSFSGEGMEDKCIKVWLNFNIPNNLAKLEMNIQAYENGLGYMIIIEFTVIALSGSPKITESRHDIAWPINIDPCSADSFQLMRSWIQKCRCEHGCGLDTHSPSSMPSMLLKIIEQGGSSFIKLIQVAPGAKHQYLALSYCWGSKTQNKVLTNDNIAEFCQDGFGLEQLDATVQDAVRVTKELGYVYLWVDALCIFQDNTPSCKAAKDTEIGRMDEIYQNAAFTIVAARAKSVKEGFSSPRSPAGDSTPDFVFRVSFEDDPWQPNKNEDRSVVLVPQEEGNWQTPAEPWESRAWTLQEDLLSGRQLRFGSRQTSWVCHCSQYEYEDRDGWFAADLEYAWHHSNKEKQLGGLVRMLCRSDLITSVNDARLAWYDLVNIYSKRSLSFRQDRLPAISAIARRMASILEDTYWCGLWKSEAPWELLWQAHEPAVGFISTQEHDDQRDIGPSWTWASQGASIEFLDWDRDRPSFRVDEHFEILHHVAQYASEGNIYGAVTAARLKVRGLITPAPFKLQQCHKLRFDSEPSWALNEDTIEPSEEESDGTYWSLRQIMTKEGSVRLDRSPCELLADQRLNVDHKQIVLLFIGHHRDEGSKLGISGPMGLVLLNEGGGRFSRLGTFAIHAVYSDSESSESYYGGNELNVDEHVEFFQQLWGGQECVREIVLI